jgi:hypothetical protein
MATTRRDIELLISAKETTGRSFKQVTDNIDALNTKIAEQIVQAERGEISLQELRKTQEQLAAAGRDLSAIQGQIDAYNRLVATSDKVAASAEKAKADLAALKAEVEAAGKATTAQENKMARLEVAVTRTSAALDKNTADIAEQVAVLQRAGVAVENLDQAQAGIINNARQIGAGLVQVNTAIDGYAGNIQRAQQAEAGLAAQQGFERKIAEAQRLGQASRFVQLFGDAINTVKVADNQLAALSGFRAIGAQAAEASNDMSRFVQAGQTMAVSSQQVAAGLRAILDPGGAALQTLKGVEAAIDAADAQAAEGVKNVGLLSDAYNNLAASAAALLRQGALVDSFRQQEAATITARQQFAEAQAEVQRLGAAMAAADEPTEQLAAALAKAEANLEKTGRALSQEEAKLGVLNRELKTAEINTANLSAEQARLEAAASRVGTTMERVNTTLGRGGRATNGLFGLKPNDLANLSFQLNDIFVSLASGQNPLIVLIQQGSQIGQIFPGLISTIARFALAWSPVIAVVGAVSYALYLAAQNANRLTDAQNQLAASANGVNYKAEEIVAQAEALGDLGVAYADAAKAIKVFTDEGLDPEKVNEYSEAAANLAQRLGIDVAEAAELVNGINTGGIEQLDQLQEKTLDLTAAEYDHATALFNAGKAAEARQYILDIVANRNEEIASRTRSIWIPAVNNLQQAFSNFGDFLASVLSGRLTTLRAELDNIAIGAAYLFGLLSGKGFEGAKADARAVFDTIKARDSGAPVGGGMTPQELRDRRFSAQLDEEELQNRKAISAQERLQIAALKARNEAQAAGVSKAVEERAVQQAIALEQRKINEEGARAGRRSDAAAARARRAAETEQRKRESAQQQLERQLRQLNRAAFSGVSASLEERLASIDEKYESIADSIQKVRDLGLTTDSEGVSLDVIEAQVAATKTRLKDEETIKFYQEQAALLDKQREAELQRITDAQLRGAISTKEAMEQAAEVNTRLSPQIVSAAQAALDVARRIAGTNPSPEMVSWIASLERVINAEGTNRAVADVGLAGLDQESTKLDDLLKQRDMLVDAYGTLNDLGLRTATQTREAMAGAFLSQAEAIRPVLDQLRATVEALHNQIDPLTQLPVLTDTAYATWLAKIEAVNAGLTQTTTKLTALESSTFQSIATAGVNAFETLTSSMAGFAAGTQSLGDVFASVGTSILQSLAQITQAIANAIIQFLILRALESAAGLPPGTLSGGGGGPSLFGLFHDGGVVGGRGGSKQRRSGMSDSWVGAPKFHGGGGMGLRPDEYKAVLKRGEEVLTEDDPRHVRNIGNDNDGGGAGGLKQVLLLDPEAVPSAMQSRAGQKSILTVIRQNKDTIKQVLS